MLEVQNIAFDYFDKPLLSNINFSVEPGKLLHIRGKNGAGKTTILKLLVGLLRPSKGDVCYKGCSITNNRSIYQQNICYVGHKSGVSQYLTMREQYSFELQQSTASIEFNTLIKQVGLNGLEDVVCGQLSSGQLRRVALLRILFSKASLWLLDEPLVGLDNASTGILMHAFQKHLENKGQIVVTSHQPLILDATFCHDYYL